MNDCPTYIIALLKHIDWELSVLMWNQNQEEYESPFDNTGNTYENQTFEVSAFNWGTEEDGVFKYKDIEITWYKHLGRGTLINREITPDEAVDMFNDCLESLIKDL